MMVGLLGAAMSTPQDSVKGAVVGCVGLAHTTLTVLACGVPLMCMIPYSSGPPMHSTASVVVSGSVVVVGTFALHATLPSTASPIPISMSLFMSILQ